MTKPWFYRLLFSYLPVFFMITSVLIVLIILSISHLSKREAENANQTYALHIMQSVDYTLKTIDEYVIKELQTNQRIDQFFDNKLEGNPYYSAYEVTELIRGMMNYNKFIDSVYFYRAYDQMVISPNTMITADRFGDKSFIDEMMKSPSQYELTNQRQYKEFTEMDQRKVVISLVRKFPLLSGQKGIIVVNISMDAIVGMIRDMSNTKISFIQVYDPAGNQLLASENGHAITGSELTRIHSNYTNWEYRSGLNDQYLYTFTSVFSYVWIGLGLVMIVLGGVWMTYVTHRNYRPIQLIMSRIHAISDLQSMSIEGKKKDEFQYIDRAISNLMEISSRYEKQHEEDIVFRRRHFFKEWLEGSRTVEYDDWKVEMNRLHLPTGFGRLTAAVIEMDKYMEICRMFSEKDQELLKFVLSRVVYETAESFGLTVWAEWMATHRLSVVIFTDEDVKNSEKQTANLCENIRSWVEQHLHFRITLGVGHVVGQVQELVHSYEAATHVLRFKSTLGTNRVLYHWEAEASTEKEMYKHLPLIKSLAQSFRLGDEGWKAALEQFFTDLKVGLLSYDEIRNLMNYFAYHLHREMIELSADLQESIQIALPQLHDATQQFDTIEELYASCFHLLDQASQRMADIREVKSNHAVMRQIRTYVETHYADPELSLSSLSEQFQLHASQISRAFKEEFGEKFVDYLVKIRMEQAQHLLQSSRHSVQEIGVQVGYTHAISFIRAFKKFTGVTPGDYRK
ncbi:helix-turn-helix domain-containing protein [Paenibacillus chondroitinus]|uniref:Helix-turn-helix domain-containing protein n=1 Tax=Paenibacillus chondroitinus TaxID=59842 RepID=A0ABU6DFX3_9BACL|nr:MULTISPECIES: helix-turn-helix domain-containing protein [Paenibacillus]MCY9659254.1 helix-turn-helix domain-containing protein [Paenibacillus anseongense]MEB4796411.1 helix-turn-helix domain-containing protein [Paenibacillus chondroitinus]